MLELVEQLQTNTCQSLALYGPELAICATILLMLIVRVVRFGDKIDPFYLALAGAGVGMWYALPEGGIAAMGDVETREMFTGLLVYDSLAIYMRALLLGFAALFIVFCKITGLATREDGVDFYTLVLGATLGFCLMATANHMLTIFLGIEMASVPSYVLAGVLKGKRRSSEAALKYAVYGAGAAGVMLYGISLLSGLLGSAHLPTMARQLVALDLPAMIASGGDPQLMVLALAGLMILVGLAFKLSAVPFHFWCPDVFEGAPAEVGAFLSVASKAAALTLLVRVAIGFGVAPADDMTPGDNTVAASSTTENATTDDHAILATNKSSKTTLASLKADATQEAKPQSDKATSKTDSANKAETDGAPLDAMAALQPVRKYLVMLLALLAAVSCTFGNLAAYGQTNIKRMLAYSTIAHAGYMIMPVAAALAVIDTNPTVAHDAIGSMVFYVTIYLFMNTGAFAVIALFRRVLGSEEIRDYAGLIRNCPFTVVCFCALLVSLIGLPPLAGFASKLYIFKVLVASENPIMMGLLVVAGVNTAISLVYYLRVIKVMTIDTPVEGSGSLSIPLIPATFIVAMTAPVLILGVYFEELLVMAGDAAKHLFM